MITITDLFNDPQRIPFTDLILKEDPSTGLQAIIAIHSTKLGPALGGCRFIEYPDTQSAIIDALRLAKGMSYKSAISGLDFGGGKAVIIKPHHNFDRIALFHAFGKMVAELQGRYITAKDSGSTLDDMDTIAKETRYVASTSVMSDPSPYTAHGVLRGMEAALLHEKGHSDLSDLTIAIQGVGYVGYFLAKELHERGAKLIVADIDANATLRCQIEFGAQIVDSKFIHQMPCDIFSPCALGGILNDETIPALNTKIIAGAANNQLESSAHGDALRARGILYAPDYLINAGGLIQATAKYQHASDTLAKEKIHNIYLALLDVFKRADALNLSTHTVADHIAEERLAA